MAEGKQEERIGSGGGTAENAEQRAMRATGCRTGSKERSDWQYAEGGGVSGVGGRMAEVGGLLV